MGRKLIVVLGLVAALTLGFLATAPSRHAAQAAADSVVLVWNEEALEAIRNVRRGPTVNARALAIIHTAVYDAWAAYDPVAVGTRLGGGLRQPEAERTLADKQRAVSFAAYTAFLEMFPTRTANAEARMAALGYVVDGSDTSTAAMVGMTAAQAVLDFRRNDGPTRPATTPTPAAISRSTPGTRSWTPTAGSRCACPPHPRAPPAVQGRCSGS